MKNLLVITQKVDRNDQLLGFFINWLKGLSERFDKVTVLCLEKGEFNLPGVQVISLGKDRGLSKISWVLNFYKQIFGLQSNYDSVFVHMNPIWVVAGGLPWRLMKKKITLWYTHKAVTTKLKIAEKFANIILTASKESFRLPSKKVVVTGHGIDTELFKPDHTRKSDKLSILSVGRISLVKNYETMIEAAKILADEGVDFEITIIGEPSLKKDKEYERRLTKRINDLELDGHFKFLGKIPHRDLANYYQANHLFIHLSKTGSLDKTSLEAMASGMNILSSNDSAKRFLPKELTFDEGGAKELAQKIKSLIDTEPHKELREYVLNNHELNNLLDKIYSLTVGAPKNRVAVYPLPFSSKSNKYIDLLYKSIGDRSRSESIFEIKKMGGLFDIIKEARVNKRDYDKNIIHIHWSTILYGSKYLIKSIYLLYKNFFILLLLKKIYGFKVCWTMHNYYAHDYPHPFIDKIGRKLLFMMSDVVIIQQKDEAEQYRNKKVVFLPHGNYINAYGPIINENNKEKYGFNGDDIVILSLGMIRPYKKVDKLIKFFNDHRDSIDKRIKLFVVGNCSEEYERYLKKLSTDNKNIRIDRRFVEDKEIPEYFSLADYSIFWYGDSVLTSGGIMLSLSYGIPVVTRQIAAADMIVDGKNGFTYNNEDKLLEILKKISEGNKIDSNNVINSVTNMDWKNIANSLRTLFLEI